MPANSTVLAACPSFALPALEKALGGYMQLVHAASLEQAQAILQSTPAISLVICGVHFDDSRMYDLLSYARREYPHIPFVCVRVLDAEIPKISREALRIAAESLGATAFIDLPALKENVGARHAEEVLRTAVTGRLRQRPPAKEA